MSFRHGPRVKHTSTTTGTGTLSLIAPATGFQGFNNAYGAGPVVVYYAISGATYYEVGLGTFDNAGPTLTRTTILASSNGGAPVSLPAATHDVFSWEPAGWPVQAITGNTTLVAADVFGFILFSGGSAATLTLPAIATLAPGAAFPVLNLGTALLTIDGNAAETINGSASITLFPGEGCWLHYRDTATAQWGAIVSTKRRNRNAQVGTTYTVLLSDNDKHVTLSNAASIAVTLPVATTLPDGWSMFVENIGVGTATITPTTSTINLGTTLVLRSGEWALITSDGTNYRALTTGAIGNLPLVREIGTRGIAQNIQDAAYQFALTDSGGHVYKDSATGRTWTIPANGTTAFPIGTAITLINGVGVGDISLVITTDTLRRGDGVAGTGTRTIKPNSVATIIKTKSTEWMISGAFT